MEEKVIRRLFTRLEAIYPDFSGAVSEWRDVLADVDLNIIAETLKGLDPKARYPEASEFLMMCLPPVKEPEPPVWEIVLEEEAPKPLPSKIGVPSCAWAFKLKDRYLAGEPLSRIQIDYAEHVCGPFTRTG